MKTHFNLINLNKIINGKYTTPNVSLCTYEKLPKFLTPDRQKARISPLDAVARLAPNTTVTGLLYSFVLDS